MKVRFDPASVYPFPVLKPATEGDVADAAAGVPGVDVRDMNGNRYKRFQKLVKGLNEILPDLGVPGFPVGE